MSLPSPSRAQIALALIVLQSKPPELSTEEYIDQIRSAIVRRKRKVLADSPNYIDGTLFWKKAYEKSETENSKLLDKIFDLEQTVERNKSMLLESQVVSRRTADVSGTSKANIQSKRRKVELQNIEQSVEDYEKCQLKLIVLEHHSLLRAFYMLRTNLRERKPSAQNICQSVKTLCFAIGKALQHTCRNSAASQTATPRIEEILQIAVKSWMSLLDALRKIVELGSDLFLECIPALVQFFQRVLGQVQQTCLDKADKQVKNNKRRTTRGNPGAETNAAASLIFSVESATEPWQRICATMARLCYKILDALDCSDKAQLILFEGILCVLLDLIGSSVSLLVFAQPDTSLKQQEGLLPPRGLLDVAHIDSETALLTSQLTAPYLILILQQVMKITNGLNSDQKSRLLKKTSSSPETERGLADKLREQLQNTLLRGIYGDGEAAFANSLARSAQPDEAEADQLLKSLEQARDSSEWFVGQVWENLGWDILVTEEGNRNG